MGGRSEQRPGRGGGRIGGLALCVGAALALAAPWELARRAPPRPGPPRWVVADRDASALVLLDEDLLVAGRHPLPWPTHVRAHPAGGVWVVSATRGHPRSGLELRRVGPGGRAEAVHAVPPVLDLEVDSRGHAWLLVRPEPAGEEVWRVLPGATPERVLAVPGAVDLAARGTQLAIAAGPAGLGLLEEAGGWRALRREPGEEVLAVTASAEGPWWLLVRRGPADGERVLALDGELRVRSQAPCAGGSLLAASGPDGVWALGDGGGWARRIDLRVRRSSRRTRLPARGGRAASADLQGGLLVAAGGALLRLDGEGRTVPGQGGFAHLVGLDALASW